MGQRKVRVKGIYYEKGKIRVPGVYYERSKKRYVFELWVPKDVLPIIGGNAKFKAAFAQHVDLDTAHELAATIWEELQRKWNEARHGADPERLAGDLIARQANPTEFRRPPPEATKLLVRRAGAVLGTIFDPRVPANRREAVEALVHAHYARQEEKLEKMEALLLDIRAALSQQSGDNWQDLRERMLKAVAQAPTDDHPLVECETVLLSWAKERSIAAKSLRQRREIMRAFFDWLHDNETTPKTPLRGEHFDMATIREPDLKRYRTHLVDSICDDYTAVTARKELADLKTLFNYAHDDMGEMESLRNPAASIKNIKAEESVRDGFEPHERALLIREAVKSDSAIIKWANLFGGYLGITLAEIAEIQTTDFEEYPLIDNDGIVKGETLVIKIRNRERKKENPHQRVKTKERVRRLPVPLPIIRAGFRVHLASIIAEYGHGALFREVKKDQDGRRNTYASNEIAAWLNSLVTDEDKSFHSWRATVRTTLENTGCSSDRARWIVGHAPRDVDARNYLKHPVPDLIEALGKLSDPLAPEPIREAA